MSKELKWSDDDIRDIREALIELNSINEELNAKIIAMNAYVKNGDAKLKHAQLYINQLELAVMQFTNVNYN